MRNYVRSFCEAFGSGLVKNETIKRHIEEHALIDKFLPDSASFFYILATPYNKYNFFGKQQENLSGYTNEEFLKGGIELFIECLHPEEVDIILNQLYPETIEFVARKVREQFNNIVFNYNYRFKKKSGEYINLMENVYFLDTNSDYKPTLLLGNVITLDNSNVLPIRSSLKLYKNKISETIFYKNYTTSKSILNNITAREMDILRNLSTGKTSKEIGEALFISPNTVDTHRRNLLAKLKCKSVVEMLRLAFKNGLL